MIDGIKGGNRVGGPFLASSQPAAEIKGSDPGKPVRRIAASMPAPSATGGNRINLPGLVRDMAAGPPVDTARVAALKASIAAGQYRIDPDAIASAMMKLDRSKS